MMGGWNREMFAMLLAEVVAAMPRMQEMAKAVNVGSASAYLLLCRN